MTNHKKSSIGNLAKNEDGLVAITVTLIVMLIISLITISFAKLMAREQRQTLDRQLSTQAFYAAESGVNDALNAIKNGAPADKDNCKTDSISAIKKDAAIDEKTGLVDYTCLLIKSALSDVRFDNVTPEKGHLVALQTSNGANLKRIRIEWDQDPKHTDVTGDDKLRSKNKWSDKFPEMLRIVIYRRGDPSKPGSYDSKTYFLTPSINNASTPGLVDISAENGTIVQAHCSVSREFICRADISGNFDSKVRSSSSDQGDTIVGVQSIYRWGVGTTVRLSAYTDPSDDSKQQTLVGAQYLIDSTGKDNDVLRRIQVRVAQSNNDDFIYAPVLESAQTLCKQFSTSPGSTIPDTSLAGCVP